LAAPAWLARAMFSGLGLDATLPVKLFVYASIELIVGIASWID
jgi:hypothetical protein